MNEVRHGTPEDLTEAVGRAQAGDREAFGLLYDAHIDRIYRYVRVRVGDDLDAEDLTEQVFMRSWLAIGRYQDRGKPFAAWLYAIAGNCIADQFRSKRAPVQLDPALVDQSPANDPVAASEREQRREELHAAIRRLTPDQQQIVVLRFIEGWSPAEVAEATGKREGTVRVVQHRALAAPRAMLGAEANR